MYVLFYCLTPIRLYHSSIYTRTVDSRPHPLSPILPRTMDTEFDSVQYSTFKDCLATRVLSMPEYHGTSTPDVDTDDEGSSLDEFTSYLASSVWPSIPQHIRELTHVSGSIPTREELEELIEAIDAPSEFVDTLVSYGLVTDESDISSSFLLPVLTSYTSIAAAPPQTTNWSATRSLVDGCELCGRDVPLTYHHLIPRSVHDKAVKRGWHEERMLGSVAWLCRCVTISSNLRHRLMISFKYNYGIGRVIRLYTA